MVFPRSRNILTKLKEVHHIDLTGKYLYNRNPRNLEKLRIAFNNDGFHLEKQGKSFYHKLVLDVSKKFVTAKVVHVHDGVIIEASTKEWAIKKQLYKPSDVSAYVNLANVFSQRCLRSGFFELRCDLQPEESGKLTKFIDTLKSNGIILTSDFKRINPTKPLFNKGDPTPWEIIVE